MNPAPGTAKPQLGEIQPTRAELGLSAPSVPPGYKQTEVGVIPEEWEAGSLGRFWSVTDCKHVTATFVPSGFPLASIREVQSRCVDLTNAKQTTQHFYDLLIEGGRKPQPGDLILSRNATVGEVAQVTEFHPLFAMGQDVCLLRKKSSKHSTEFLQAIFESPIIQNQLSNLMVGSTFKRANVEQIRNFDVPMPSPPEQRAIAAALSDVDTLLASLDRLIAKKRDLKQAAMQQLLTGQTRLPGFHEEWVVKRFGDVAFPKRDRIDPRKIGVQEFCVELEHIESASGELLGSTSTGDQASLKSVFSAGDVLFGKLRAYLRKHWLATRSGVCSTEIWVFTPKDRLTTTAFLFQIVKTDEFIEVASNSYGTHMPRSDWNIVKNYEFKVPPLPEQTAIAAVLTEMDQELAALEQRQAKTRALKQGMMQELLTGRTRLPGNAEPQLGASMKSK